MLRAKSSISEKRKKYTDVEGGAGCRCRKNQGSEEEETPGLKIRVSFRGEGTGVPGSEPSREGEEEYSS